MKSRVNHVSENQTKFRKMNVKLESYDLEKTVTLKYDINNTNEKLTISFKR